MALIELLKIRLISAFTTVPSSIQCVKVLGITAATSGAAGAIAVTTNFVSLSEDYNPPTSLLRPASAFFFPSLLEETIWRAALLPSPSSPSSLFSSLPQYLQQQHSTPSHTYKVAFVVLAAHVLSHPIAGATVWPRGKHAFGDVRFLTMATVVLGGATLSYLVSGGSVWAAAFTHAVPVALWRDFFGGEAILKGEKTL